MKLFTVGYGGRNPRDFVTLLRQAGVRTIIDVRLEPNRASMGSYVKAKSADRGIEKLLGDAGITYHSLTALGNPFRHEPDWPTRYAEMLEEKGPELAQQLLECLEQVPGPACLLCAEKRVAECHRQYIAIYMARMHGCEVVHLE